MFLVLETFENMWANQETFLPPGKKILFPQKCFPRWANMETFIGNVMFPQQCFLVCPMPKSNRHSLCNVLSHVVLFTYLIKLNISTRIRVKNSIKEVIL